MAKNIFFKGAVSCKYRCFSNFYEASFWWGGKKYATAEHFFQACKATNEDDREAIRKAPTPAIAKSMGRKIKLRDDWEKVKVSVMRIGITAKFKQNPELLSILLKSEGEIHEDRPDPVWGWNNGNGKDYLGKILTCTREAFKKHLT